MIALQNGAIVTVYNPEIDKEAIAVRNMLLHNGTIATVYDPTDSAQEAADVQEVTRAIGANSKASSTSSTSASPRVCTR